MSKALRYEDVKARIDLLETETRVLEEGLKHQFKKTYESITPGNLLKSVFNGISSDSGIKAGIFESIMKLAFGYFSGRLLMSPSASLTKKAVVAALQLGAGRNLGKKLSVWKRFLTGFFTKDKKVT